MSTCQSVEMWATDSTTQRREKSPLQSLVKVDWRLVTLRVRAHRELRLIPHLSFVVRRRQPYRTDDVRPSGQPHPIACRQLYVVGGKKPPTGVSLKCLSREKKFGRGEIITKLICFLFIEISRAPRKVSPSWNRHPEKSPGRNGFLSVICRPGKNFSGGDPIMGHRHKGKPWSHG